jgi:small-conductance mechanosensitive channel
MQFPELVMTMLGKWLPAVFVAAGCAIAIFLTSYWLFRRQGARLSEDPLRRQLILILLCAAAVVAVILALPLSEATRGQLLGLLGLLLSAAIALSSTTLIGNAMAGIMLRTVGNFRPGDFVQTGEHFGRVSERGLFHVEIQTEDRDLTTLPNLYLLSHPVKVVRSSGTIVSAHVSLGYDVPRAQIEGLLLEAAQTAGLAEPFVQIFELGDFSVTYRAAGLLEEVKELLPARSRLRAAMLDTLHRSGIEIVSPSFMNQRALPPEKVFIPELAPYAPVGSGAPDAPPERLVFDKAEEAESREALREQLKQIQERVTGLQEQRSALPEHERERVDQEISRLERDRERVATVLGQKDKTDSS